MLSDLKMLSGGSAETLSSSSPSPKMSPLMLTTKSLVTSGESSPTNFSTLNSSHKKSSLFTVDSLLAPSSKDHHSSHNHHHTTSSNSSSIEYNDLSPPATPPSPAQVLKPLAAVPNSPAMFPQYPFPYGANLLIPGLHFPTHGMQSWHGLKFPTSLAEMQNSHSK